MNSHKRPPEDESWEKTELDEAFIRDAAVTEPAAHTREVSARWRREGCPEPEPWRAGRPPAGWFFSRRRRRRRWWRRAD